jgi:hypothetical protein
MHPVDRSAGRLDERLAHELRPPDHEGHVRLERRDGRDGIGCVDVGRFYEPAAETGRDVVERALTRAIRVDRAGKRDDTDDVRTGSCRRLEAVAADDVEADPDRPQGAGNTRRTLPRRSSPGGAA